MRCAVCQRPLAYGQGFANAHAAVCSFQCSGIWNQQHNVNYAWGPNRKHSMGPFGDDEEDAEYVEGEVISRMGDLHVVGPNPGVTVLGGGNQQIPAQPQPQPQQQPQPVYDPGANPGYTNAGYYDPNQPTSYDYSGSGQVVPGEMFDQVLALAQDKRSRALTLFLEVPFFAYVALNPRLPGLIRFGAAALGFVRAVEVYKKQQMLEAYLPAIQ